MNGKCPKCEKVITQVTSSSVDIKVLFGSNLKGVSYFCPFCETVLGVQADPVSLKTEIVNAILDKLPRFRI